MLFGAMWAAVGCQKEPPPVIRTIQKGRVLAYGTKKPIAGAQVILYECSSDGMLFGSYYCEAIDTLITDKTGEYFFDLTNKVSKGGYSYEVGVSAEGYAKPFAIDVFGGQTREKDFILDPFAWVKIFVKNEPPVDINDIIKVNGDWGGGSFDGLTAFGDCDTSIKRQVRGNRPIYIYYFLENNGTKTFVGDSVYCKGFDTTRFEVNY